jgi:hypothetical protein
MMPLSQIFFLLGEFLPLGDKNKKAVRIVPRILVGEISPWLPYFKFKKN